MSLNTLVFVNLVAILALFTMLVGVMLRLRNLESKFVDVTPKDVAAYVEQMREILIESERSAEILDSAIKEREAALEDLSDLVDAKINRLNELSAYQTNTTIETLPEGKPPLQNKVYRLLLQGYSEENIAKELGISVLEVNMLINMVGEGRY